LPPVIVDTPVVLVNNQIQLTIEGAPGQIFAIQMSTNFIDWTSLITNTLFHPRRTGWIPMALAMPSVLSRPDLLEP